MKFKKINKKSRVKQCGEKAALYGAEVAEEKAWNKITGKKIATKDFSFKTLDGKEIKAGQSFNLKDIPKEHRFEAFKMSKIEPGSIGKFMNWAKHKLNESGLSIRDSFTHQSHNESINSSNNAQNQHSDKSPESKSNNHIHSQPPSNQSDLSINENGKNVNLNS